MTISTILLAKVGASAAGVAVVGGTSYVVVQNSTTIQKFFTSNKSTDNEAPINNPEVSNKPTQEQVVADKKTDATLPATESLEDTEYVYFVAEYSETGKNATTELYSNTSSKDYICQLTKTDSSLANNASCQIFKLANTEGQKTVINLTDTAAASTSEVKQLSDLTNTSHYLLKLSKTFAAALDASSNKGIEILHKTETTNNNFGKFTKFIDLSKDVQKVTPTEAQSNLFSVLLTEASSATTFDENSSYICKIGTNQTDIACKVYKLSKTYATEAKTVLDGSVGKISNQTDLVKDNYVLVDLESSHKTLAELDGKVVIVKTTDSQTFVTGLAEQLLVGSANPDTSAESNLFIVSDSYPTLTNVTVNGTEKAYILTKGGAQNTLPNVTDYTSNQYLCRVIEGSNKYDDESCKLFAFPAASKPSFEFENYKGTSGTEITAIAELASSKYQVVELKKELQTALNKPSASLHLVKIDRKEKAINNKLLALTKEADLADSTAETTTLKTNLFLVRYNSGHTNTDADLTNTEALTCDIGDGSNLPCKIYKFTDTAIKSDNALTNENIATLTPITSTSASFVDNSYLAIELTNTKKTIAELKNKTISLKNSGADIGKFDFDQIIMGKAGKAGLPDKATFDSYIVKRPNSLTGSTSITSYSCKLAAATSNVVNYDSTCELIKIVPTSGSQITSFDTAKTSTNKLEAASLAADTDNYYKLKINNKLLYNLSFDENSTNPVNIELIKNGTESLGNFEILQKLSSEAFIGKTNLLFAQVTKQGTPITGTLIGEKCNFDEANLSDASKQLGCQIYKAEKGSETSLEKYTITQTAASTAETFTNEEYYVISLNDPKKIGELKTGAKIFYQIQDSTETSKYNNIELKIVALMSGEFLGSKKPIFITSETNP